jgi:hypothetical protein
MNIFIHECWLITPVRHEFRYSTPRETRFVSPELRLVGRALARVLMIEVQLSDFTHQDSKLGLV